MAMFLIAGSLRITGAQPDGDSIRFTPDDPAKWDLITGPNRVKRNAGWSGPAAGWMRLTRWRPTTGARGLINRWIWRMPPRQSCSTGWVSAMLFADKMKRSHQAAPTRSPALF